MYAKNVDPTDQKKLSAQSVGKFFLCYTRTGYKLWDPVTHSDIDASDIHSIQSTVYGDKFGKHQKPESKWTPLEDSSEGQDWLVGPVESKEKETSGKETENNKYQEESDGEYELIDQYSEYEYENESENEKKEEEDEFEIEKIEEMILDEEERNEGEKSSLFMIKRINTLQLPKTVQEALSDYVWKEAMENEYKSVKKSGAIELVDKRKGQNVIDSKWVFTVKTQPDGSWIPKARIVVRGFKEHRKYAKHETYAPVAKIAMIRMVLSIANKFKLPIHQFDVKTAFLYGDLNENSCRVFRRNKVER